MPKHPKRINRQGYKLQQTIGKGWGGFISGRYWSIRRQENNAWSPYCCSGYHKCEPDKRLKTVDDAVRWVVDHSSECAGFCNKNA